MSVFKKCECGGNPKESGEYWVLPDGYELPIYKCEDCGKEIK
ncbi:hypothetical protein [Bacillus inaquosorum]